MKKVWFGILVLALACGVVFEAAGSTALPDFFQYLGMSFKDIEAKLGLGEEAVDLQYEIGYVVYKFSNSNYRFIFSFPYDGPIADVQCTTMAVPLKEIIMSGDRTRIPRNELEQYFSIENWPDTPDLIDGHDAPWSNVYTIWGKYRGYHFNVYLDASEENKTSSPSDAYFYFYYDSSWNDPSVNP